MEWCLHWWVASARCKIVLCIILICLTAIWMAIVLDNLFLLWVSWHTWRSLFSKTMQSCTLALLLTCSLVVKAMPFGLKSWTSQAVVSLFRQWMPVMFTVSKLFALFFLGPRACVIYVCLSVAPKAIPLVFLPWRMCGSKCFTATPSSVSQLRTNWF